MKRQRDGESEDHPEAKKPRLNSLILSTRLSTITSYVRPNSSVADVACHHAHVAVYLALHNIAARVIGTELTEGSWRVAQDTVLKYRVQDRVNIRLGDGLQPIDEGEVDTVIIAGVGTALAVTMLQQRAAVVAQAQRLILQPQFECEEMRRYLHSIHFTITEEVMLEENHQYYTIIVAEPGSESYESYKDYKYGRLLLARSDPILVRWWEAKLAKLLKNIAAIEKKISGTNRPSDNANMKLAELKTEVDHFRDLIQLHKQTPSN